MLRFFRDIVMLIVETNAAHVARKTSIVMGILFAIAGSFGALFTMHVYVNRKPPPPRGFRVLGIPIGRRRNAVEV
jgi:hypothetical protein